MPEPAVVLLEIPSTFEALQLVDPVAERFGSTSGLDDEGVHAFVIAIREAAANAVKHGNGCDPQKRVHIVFDRHDENSRCYVTVRVRDEGTGFDPGCVPDPLADENVSLTSGRGLLLMRSFMDDVSVCRTPNGGTELVMVKAVSRPVTVEHP